METVVGSMFMFISDFYDDDTDNVDVQDTTRGSSSESSSNRD